MVNAPLTHLVEAQKLTADAYVDLFRFTLQPSGVIYFKNNETVFWQGNSWEGLGIKMSGTGKYADEKVARPTLTAQNPDGVFSNLIAQGALTGAEVSRFRVLRTDLENDRAACIQETWGVARVASLNRNAVTLELRDILDGPNFVIPAKTYSPPEFPVVMIR